MIWKNMKYFLIILAFVIAMTMPLGVVYADDNATNDDSDDDVDDDSDDSDDDSDDSDDDSDDSDDDSDDVDDDSDDVDDDDDENDSIAFKTNYGAEVRLIQLEKQIQRNILQGELVLERIYENLTDDELDYLDAILLSLEELKKEVSEYEFKGQREDVKAFVDFKKQSIELTKEFRDEVRELFTEEQRSNTRAEINRRIQESDALDEYKNRARERARLHNEEVIKQAIESVVDEDLLERIRTGDIEPEQIREEIMQRIRNNTSENTQAMIRELREDAARQKIEAKNEVARIRNEMNETYKDAVQQRIQTARENMPENIRERFENNTRGIIQNARMR